MSRFEVIGLGVEDAFDSLGRTMPSAHALPDTHDSVPEDIFGEGQDGKIPRVTRPTLGILSKQPQISGRS